MTAIDECPVTTTSNPLKNQYRRDLTVRIQACRDKIAATAKEICDLEDILLSLGGPLVETPGANAYIPTQHFSRSIPELILDILRRHEIAGAPKSSNASGTTRSNDDCVQDRRHGTRPHAETLHGHHRRRVRREVRSGVERAGRSRAQAYRPCRRD
jgi:hypothetical protein